MFKAMLKLLYFVCFGFWFGLACMIFGSVLQVIPFFGPIGSLFVRQGFRVMTLDG